MEYPTAVQLAADAHEMAFSSTWGEPDTPGVGWLTHDVPFQRSTRAFVLPVRRYHPAAVQVAAVAQETPDRKLLVPEGVGTGWIDHLIPFQRSASASVRAPLGLGWDHPTAIHLAVAEQETPSSWLPPGGLGVASIIHPVAALTSPAHNTTQVTTATQVIKRRNMTAYSSPVAGDARDKCEIVLLALLNSILRPPPRRSRL